MDTTIMIQTAYPPVQHVSVEYLDKDNQACNFVETQWKDGVLYKNTIIFLN